METVDVQGALICTILIFLVLFVTYTWDYVRSYWELVDRHHPQAAPRPPRLRPQRARNAPQPPHHQAAAPIQAAVPMDDPLRVPETDPWPGPPSQPHPQNPVADALAAPERQENSGGNAAPVSPDEAMGSRQGPQSAPMQRGYPLPDELNIQQGSGLGPGDYARQWRHLLSPAEAAAAAAASDPFTQQLLRLAAQTDVPHAEGHSAYPAGDSSHVMPHDAGASSLGFSPAALSYSAPAAEGAGPSSAAGGIATPAGSVMRHGSLLDANQLPSEHEARSDAHIGGPGMGLQPVQWAGVNQQADAQAGTEAAAEADAIQPQQMQPREAETEAVEPQAAQTGEADAEAEAEAVQPIHEDVIVDEAALAAMNGAAPAANANARQAPREELQVSFHDPSGACSRQFGVGGHLCVRMMSLLYDKALERMSLLETFFGVVYACALAYKGSNFM